jgi:hypothetical protein
MGRKLMLLNTKLFYVRMHIFFFFGFLFMSCTGSDSDSDIDPITVQQFTFHQDANKLYFGVSVENKYQSERLDSVMVKWYAGTRTNTSDLLKLYDNGTQGDILMNDGLYSRKVSNDSTNITNVMGDASGYVYVDYVAKYGSETVMVSDSFKIGNIIPKIQAVFAPETIVRPSGENISLHLIKAEVYDADGPLTIKWAGFRSFHIEGDSLMNNGNYLYLYDDGGDVILYEPNFTSGDSIEGDGIYSFRIPVYGTGFTDPNFQTRAGTFSWRFLSQDHSNDYSNVVEHEITIQ